MRNEKRVGGRNFPSQHLLNNVKTIINQFLFYLEKHKHT